MENYTIFIKTEAGYWDKVKDYNKENHAITAFRKIRKDPQWYPKSEFRLVKSVYADGLHQNFTIKKLKLR